ncbi:hypothetical protein P154DRAFT_532278 [Amniculicola lignicola CBS 123094]|uniref:Uncharacterized protein n=1 Tax=Amniculicola lignicola CBS 123094 TaxID=1392246 RepID=A0A6A5WTL7_9PLEO|nr:hypothetical protein P154DRAFT_532278 [Amniculicola lignicola CBS 123094]
MSKPIRGLRQWAEDEATGNNPPQNSESPKPPEVSDASKSLEASEFSELVLAPWDPTDHDHLPPLKYMKDVPFYEFPPFNPSPPSSRSPAVTGASSSIQCTKDQPCNRFLCLQCNDDPLRAEVAAELAAKGAERKAEAQRSVTMHADFQKTMRVVLEESVAVEEHNKKVDKSKRIAERKRKEAEASQLAENEKQKQEQEQERAKRQRTEETRSKALEIRQDVARKQAAQAESVGEESAGDDDDDMLVMLELANDAVAATEEEPEQDAGALEKSEQTARDWDNSIPPPKQSAPSWKDDIRQHEDMSIVWKSLDPKFAPSEHYEFQADDENPGGYKSYTIFEAEHCPDDHKFTNLPQEAYEWTMIKDGQRKLDVDGVLKKKNRKAHRHQGTGEKMVESSVHRRVTALEKYRKWRASLRVESKDEAYAPRLISLVEDFPCGPDQEPRLWADKYGTNLIKMDVKNAPKSHFKVSVSVGLNPATVIGNAEPWFKAVLAAGTQHPNNIFIEVTDRSALDDQSPFGPGAYAICETFVNGVRALAANREEAAWAGQDKDVVALAEAAIARRKMSKARED